MRNSTDKPFKFSMGGNKKHYSKQQTAKPIHLRRVERALDINNFLNNLNHALSDSDESDEDIPNVTDINIESILKESEPHSPKEYFNFKNVSPSRKWLSDILQESTDGTPEDVQYKQILKMHAYQKNLRKTKEEHYKFYGAGLISTVDHYIEVEKNLPMQAKKTISKTENYAEAPFFCSDTLGDVGLRIDDPCMGMNLQSGIDIRTTDEEEHRHVNPEFTIPMSSRLMPLHHMTQMNPPPRKKFKRFKDEEAKRKWEDMMTLKRRKLFTNIVKKEIGKQHRSKINKHKETLLQCKRIASHCMKYARQRALLSARTVKEQQWRMKRLARENIAYWKRSRRFDREVKKRLEKEAEEQRKIDYELVEAKRQQRKLNFLITQTELYAHFMSKKLGQASPEEQLRILSQLDEDNGIKLSCDTYDSEAIKEMAKKNALDAFQSEKARTKHFDQQANSCLGDFENLEGEQPQPDLFRGKLKGYQLRGMNWLANLYSQGISGILADEMGLGKTVQSIAFLCHIAEKYSVWGPFLIISPASTLHNWQQEIAKFVPDFKVVPYWGNPNERKS
nr:unnamed protein product [Callosobruchus chinensis]